TYSSSKMNYSISLLKSLTLIDKNYDDSMQVELFMDTTYNFDNQLNWLTIFEFTSTETTLEGAWNQFMLDRIPYGGFQVLSERKTEYLSQPALYEHSTYILSGNTDESINFLLQGNNSKYYLVNIQVDKEVNYPKNMRELLYCAKS